MLVTLNQESRNGFVYNCLSVLSLLRRLLGLMLALYFVLLSKAARVREADATSEGPQQGLHRHCRHHQWRD